MSAISDINIRSNLSLDSLIDFKPDQYEYAIEVDHDCFALKFHIDYDPAYYIRVTTDHDAGRYQSESLDPEMGDYIAGTEVPYYEYYDGYIVRLDKRPSCLDQDLVESIWVSAGSYEFGNVTYRIDLVRKTAVETTKLFVTGMYEDEQFNVRVPYALYVPTDYDPGKKYPIVIGLHGTGERTEPVEAIQQKMEMGTAWARDSEKGHNQCLVLIPQCLIHYDDEDNWTSLVQFINGHSNSPFWPLPQLSAVWNLLEKLRGEYSIDEKRMYLTGVSSGGFAAYVLAMDHPNAFAGLVPVSGAANPERVGELKDVPMWIFHSDDDPLIVPEWSLNPSLAAMDAAGISYRLTRYPKGMIFWQTPHFVWEVCYHDKEMRDWLFSQKRS